MARTKPSEFLVIAKKGRLVNLGAAANVRLWPGTTFVKVPGEQLEASFEMTQETQDGIPLRFKGIVMFRIVKPEIAAQMFDFTDESGLESMVTLISRTCLGELRDKVSHMTMKQCIEERKTTLTGAVYEALKQVLEGGEGGWGVSLEVVQVAQVFIVDQDLRRQLEAETRNQIKAASDLAEMNARESVSLTQIASERRVQRESLETEKMRIDMDRQKFELEKDAERLRMELEKPVLLLEERNRLEVLKARRETLELEKPIRALEIEVELMRERATQELRKEMLPLEQTPQIVGAISNIFNGADLSIYGTDSKIMGTIEPLLDLLSKKLRTLFYSGTK